jgi:hypothetical protein
VFQSPLTARSMFNRHAAQLVVRLIAERARLHGLYTQDPSDDRPPTVMLIGTAPEREAILRRLLDEREAVDGRTLLDANDMPGPLT